MGDTGCKVYGFAENLFSCTVTKNLIKKVKNSLDAELTVTMHIQTVDQLKAIKTIKGKISDIGRMKAEEQKKAVRAGYDMEILPPDLITFSKDAAELLSDLQSRNERMFLLTFLIVNTWKNR